MLNKIDLELFKILDSEIDKDYTEGLLVNDTDYGTGYAMIFGELGRSYIMKRYSDLSKPYLERKFDIETWENLGHYPTSNEILRYFKKDNLTRIVGYGKYKIEFVRDEKKYLGDFPIANYYLDITKQPQNFTDEQKLELINFLNLLPNDKN